MTYDNVTSNIIYQSKREFQIFSCWHYICKISRISRSILYLHSIRRYKVVCRTACLDSFAKMHSKRRLKIQMLKETNIVDTITINHLMQSKINLVTWFLTFMSIPVSQLTIWTKSYFSLDLENLLSRRCSFSRLLGAVWSQSKYKLKWKRCCCLLLCL